MTDETYFDEETHTYYYKGIEVPSVTEIAKPISFDRLNSIPKHIVQNASNRGKAVHSMAEEYLLVGDLDLEEVEPEYVPYMNAFIEWVFTYKPKVLFTEKRMITHEYAGTCDLICILDGKTILVDYKTTSAVDKKSLSVQLEGYSRLCEYFGIEIDECWCLHLKKNDYTFSKIKTDSEWFDLLFEHNKKMKEKYNGK